MSSLKKFLISPPFFRGFPLLFRFGKHGGKAAVFLFFYATHVPQEVFV